MIELGLRWGSELGIGNGNWMLEIGIGYRDWGLKFGTVIGIEIGNWD